MDYRGRQIFVVHPDGKIRDDLVRQLRDREYETFGMPELDLNSVLGLHNAVVILGEDDTKRQILDRLTTDERRHLTLVALGSTDSPESFDYVATAENDPDAIFGYLDRLGVRGHRHFVRFGGQYASIATFDFAQDDKHFAGVIHDISIAGLSCTFRPEPDNFPHRKIRKLRLNLPGYRTTVGGRFTAKRVIAGRIIHIFLFTGEIPREVRSCIYDFIYASLEMKLSPR